MNNAVDGNFEQNSVMFARLFIQMSIRELHVESGFSSSNGHKDMYSFGLLCNGAEINISWQFHLGYDYWSTESTTDWNSFVKPSNGKKL